jgi:hypothetical protein
LKVRNWQATEEDSYIEKDWKKLKEVIIEAAEQKNRIPTKTRQERMVRQ